ncbi:MAG: anhydro-N-acetylmuramic acid kinase, partial [Gemmatimonadota bacterium]|nr:anhydro-N-acetylmuramic acid kinase [Gemmatimonadota bacterium]
ADTLLFAAPDEWRALQNLGGIANVSVVPPAGAPRPVRAFDTGPGCVVIDAVTQALVPTLRRDDDGAMARRGSPLEPVVSDALNDGFFLADPPKSTGREQFSGAFIDRFIASCRRARPAATHEDIIASAVLLTARSIGDAYARWVPNEANDVILSGGGTRNSTLVDAISAALAPRTVRIFDDVFFDAEAKEAVAFALLGYLNLMGRPGNVPSATGARGARILGTISRHG